MTDKRLKALFDKCNFLSIGAENDYIELGRKYHKLYKRITKDSEKLTLLLDKKLKERGI